MGTLTRLKQYLAGTVADPNADYQCVSCGARFRDQPQVCPHCEGYDIRRAEWIDSTTDRTETAEEE